jgi:DNA-binding response OmpR family regulator
MLESVAGVNPADLSGIEVLLINPDEKAQSLMVQVFNGFGVRRVHTCANADQAMDIVAGATLGLIISEIKLSGDDGFAFVRRLRRSEHELNRRQPIILMTRLARLSDVIKGRDCGANLVITHPIVPGVILQRVHWLRREPRPFIEVEAYVGPDRRYHNIGPPSGMAGRRAGDLSAHVGLASTPNLSQNDIDNLFQARPVG